MYKYKKIQNGNKSINLSSPLDKMFLPLLCLKDWLSLSRAGSRAVFPAFTRSLNGKHGAAIKPLSLQEASHRGALIYAPILFLSSSSQTDLNWRGYFVLKKKKLSLTNFQERHRWWANVLLKARSGGWSLIPAELSAHGSKGRKHVILMQNDWLFVVLLVAYHTHGWMLIRASHGAVHNGPLTCGMIGPFVSHALKTFTVTHSIPSLYRVIFLLNMTLFSVIKWYILKALQLWKWV